MAVCRGDASIAELLREKMRIAAEEGNVYLTRETAQLRNFPRTEVFVICEGAQDAAFLNAIIHRLSPGSAATVVPAGGKFATATVLNSLISGAISGSARFVIIVDSDGDPYDTAGAIKARLADPKRVRIVTAHPTIETWAFGGNVGRAFPKDFAVAAKSIDITRLKAAEPSFGEFEAALWWALYGP